MAATFEALQVLGATEYEPPTKRANDGSMTAPVIDPFGNIIGCSAAACAMSN